MDDVIVKFRYNYDVPSGGAKTVKQICPNSSQIKTTF